MEKRLNLSVLFVESRGIVLKAVSSRIGAIMNGIASLPASGILPDVVSLSQKRASKQPAHAPLASYPGHTFMGVWPGYEANTPLLYR